MCSRFWPFGLLLIFLVLVAAGCSQGGQHSAAVDDVSVSGTFARATPPGQKVSAVFLVLTNAGSQAHALVGAASTVAGSVELHEHVHKDGMMQMRQVARIDVPAKGKAELKPGGYHIMLIGLKGPLTPGGSVPVDLMFADGSRLHADAPVRDIGLGMRRKR